MLTSTLIVALIGWVIVIPITVLCVADIGWRVQLWRQARRHSGGEVVPLFGEAIRPAASDRSTSVGTSGR